MNIDSICLDILSGVVASLQTKVSESGGIALVRKESAVTTLIHDLSKHFLAQQKIYKGWSGPTDNIEQPTAILTVLGKLGNHLSVTSVMPQEVVDSIGADV